MNQDHPNQLEFYSFFTKYSYLDNYGFTSGLLKRIGRKFIPVIPPSDSFTYLISNKDHSKSLSPVEHVKHMLQNHSTRSEMQLELDKSIVALSNKIISLGQDHKFQKLFNRLDISTTCYEKLNSIISESNIGANLQEVKRCLNEIKSTIVKLRLLKNKIGTSLHLTVLTKRVLGHIDRNLDLLKLRSDIDNLDYWKILIDNYVSYSKKNKSLRSYFGSHLDLLALEIVEHTSHHGEKYVADSNKELSTFFKKGLIGGTIIAVFALIKILADQIGLSDLSSAFYYSINYAVCFIIVKYVGGTIATKQPAMTASTIIKHIDRNNDLHIDTIHDIVLLVRKVIRSQLVSLLGNFLCAFLLSLGIAGLFNFDIIPNPISDSKLSKLTTEVLPIEGGALLFAAIAGIFLALSGLISGYFDNRVVAMNLSYRIKNHPLLSKLIGDNARTSLANFLDENLGTIAGNVSLGFLLGTAFLFSNILPFSIDIRHIAFSSANVGYSFSGGWYGWYPFLWALLGVLIIGLTNLFVSFSMTFILALKSRSVSFFEFRKVIASCLKDMLFNPIDYLILRSKSSIVVKQYG